MSNSWMLILQSASTWILDSGLYLSHNETLLLSNSLGIIIYPYWTFQPVPENLT